VITPNKVVYRYYHSHLWTGSRVYATLTFVFVIDEAESELAVLDLIQVLVEVLDKCFENVCELDLIFNPDKVRLRE
jgi:AP-3 complex subunit sigma